MNYEETIKKILKDNGYELQSYYDGFIEHHGICQCIKSGKKYTYTAVKKYNNICVYEMKEHIPCQITF